jgi:hypothetical protein
MAGLFLEEKLATPIPHAALAKQQSFRPAHPRAFAGDQLWRRLYDER